MLFGRIIDALVKAQAANAPPDMTALTPLLAAWVAFGLFTIGCSVLVALHADRLAHRRKQAVLTDYFEHVLQLPLSFHGGTHSGRLMKVMLTGVDALWGLWLSFFREHFAAFVSLFVLLPLSLFINWRLALLLVVLCVVFTGADRAGDPQDRHAAERGREPLHGARRAHLRRARQHRAGAGLRPRRGRGVEPAQTSSNRLLAAQMPVLSWWAMIAVLTRSATTHHDAGDLPARHLAQHPAVSRPSARSSPS